MRYVRIHLASLAFFLACTVSPNGAQALTLLECACQLNPACSIGYSSSGDLFEHASESGNTGINRLGLSLREASALQASLPTFQGEAMQWDLAKPLVGLHELLTVGPGVFSSEDLTELADQLSDEVRAISLRFRPQPVTVAAVAPPLAGSEPIVLDGVADPKLWLYAAPDRAGFEKWAAKLERNVQNAIRERFVSIAESGYFGDWKTVSGQNHRGDTTIYELRIHQGNRPRLYYIRAGRSVILVGYQIKTDDASTQTRAIQRAAEVANEFIRLQ